MLVGKILWWDSKDNNGVIKTGDGTRYYFDASVIKSARPTKLKPNTFVTFDHNTSVRGCLCARAVRIPTAKALKMARKKFCDAQQVDLLQSGAAA